MRWKFAVTMLVSVIVRREGIEKDYRTLGSNSINARKTPPSDARRDEFRNRTTKDDLRSEEE